MADSELKSTQEQAASDANLKAAEATIGVALAEYDGSRRIKERAEQAVSEFELRRLQLTHERSVYQADNARVEYAVAQHARNKAAAQLQAVENEISRRIVTSPINGVVVDKFRNVGEWAQAGEPIYRVVQMDRLRVEGMLKVTEYMPEDVAGSPVKIFVITSQGHQEEEFDATIDFVNPVVDPSGEFLIHAEFDNPRKPNGQWRVRPGLDAEIMILPPRKAPAPTAGGQ
jgi:multidrug efflux pump subunit AcrA (membrane-fusion protein)